MGSSSLSERASFSFDELEFERFRNSGQVQGFHSGDGDLDEFLNTHEVAEYERQRLGATTLVYIQGELVGYYTIAPSSIQVEWLKPVKRMKHDNVWNLEHVPALLIGRLAVRADLHGKGLGRLLVEYLIAYALEQREFPVRVVVLNATENSVEFYRRTGFVLSTHHKNKNRRQRVMFYLLDPFEQE